MISGKCLHLPLHQLRGSNKSIGCWLDIPIDGDDASLSSSPSPLISNQPPEEWMKEVTERKQNRTIRKYSSCPMTKEEEYRFSFFCQMVTASDHLTYWRCSSIYERQTLMNPFPYSSSSVLPAWLSNFWDSGYVLLLLYSDCPSQSSIHSFHLPPSVCWRVKRETTIFYEILFVNRFLRRILKSTS